MRHAAATMLLLAAASAQPAPPPPAPPPVAPRSCAALTPPTAFAGFAKAAGPSTYLAVGQPRRVALVPVRRLRFAAPPERAPDAGAVGAVLPLRIARAGTYRVALSGPLWIDMVAGSRRLPSVAHTQAPRCSGIRKIVDFRLSPGLHRLQLTGPGDPARGRQASVMVVRR